MEDDSENSRILTKFHKLPARFADREVTITFKHTGFFSSDHPELNLPIGATVCCVSKVEPSGEISSVFATDAPAERAIDIKEGTMIRAKAKTLFGVALETELTDNGSYVKSSQSTGLLILEILEESTDR